MLRKLLLDKYFKNNSSKKYHFENEKYKLQDREKYVKTLCWPRIHIYKIYKELSKLNSKKDHGENGQNVFH